MKACSIVVIEVVRIIDGGHQKPSDLEPFTLVELHQLIQQRLADRHTRSVGYRLLDV